MKLSSAIIISLITIVIGFLSSAVIIPLTDVMITTIAASIHPTGAYAAIMGIIVFGISVCQFIPILIAISGPVFCIATAIKTQRVDWEKQYQY